MHLWLRPDVDADDDGKAPDDVVQVARRGAAAAPTRFSGRRGHRFGVAARGAPADSSGRSCVFISCRSQRKRA